jgi:phospho-N-acetylmuramoyl-pentapeptide-transferase
VLPIVGFVLLATVAANTIQIISKRYFKRKVFIVAPLHHHFEALGWPAHKVTMRYWIISIMCAMIGVTIAAVA